MTTASPSTSHGFLTRDLNRLAEQIDQLASALPPASREIQPNGPAILVGHLERLSLLHQSTLQHVGFRSAAADPRQEHTLALLGYARAAAHLGTALRELSRALETTVHRNHPPHPAEPDQPADEIRDMVIDARVARMLSSARQALRDGALDLRFDVAALTLAPTAHRTVSAPLATARTAGTTPGRADAAHEPASAERHRR